MDVTRLLKDTEDSKSSRTFWFFVPDHEHLDKPPKVLVYRPKPKELDTIRKRCRKRRFGGRRSKENVVEQQVLMDTMDLMVRDWENINDENGEKLPVTFENKKALHDNWNEFQELWMLVLGDTHEAESFRVEDEVKN